MSDVTTQPNTVNPTERLGCFFGSGVKLVFSHGQARLRLPIARLGTFVHPKYGTVDFTQRDFDEIVENFANDEVGFTPWLRYGHSVLPTHIERTLVDHQPKIGNLLHLAQDGDVLYGYFEPLSELVVSQVKNREYEGASCEVMRGAIGKDGRPIGTVLMAHALTNSPFVPNMPALQVLSENAGSTTSCEVLDMTQREGEPTMEINQLLSQLASGEIELNSVDAATIAAVRKRLNAAEADPKMELDNKAGKSADVKLSAEASSMVTDNEAGKDADVKLSAEGNPFAKAGEALKKDADEKNSLSEQLLSAAINFFKSKKNDGDDKKDAQKFSAGTVQTDTQDSAPEASVKLSAGAAPTSETSSKEGETDMNKEDLQQMLTAAVTTAVAGVEQKFSASVAERDAKITELTEKLSKTEAGVAAAHQEAQKFSNSMVQNAFDARFNGLVAAGIPRSVVEPLKEIASMVRGTAQKFSNGAEVTLDEAIARALEATPGHLRVSHDQVGQQFSVGAGNDQPTQSAAAVFGDIVPGLKQ